MGRGRFAICIPALKCPAAEKPNLFEIHDLSRIGCYIWKTRAAALSDAIGYLIAQAGSLKIMSVVSTRPEKSASQSSVSPSL